MTFSKRYGYVKPIEILKRGQFDKDCATALCNCFDYLAKWLNIFDVNNNNHYDESYTQLEEHIWCFFMNQRLDDFYEFNSHKIVATEYLLSDNNEWFRKFDMIEFSLRVLRNTNVQNRKYADIIDTFVKLINATFQRMDYAYRIVDGQIVEITNKEEIVAIEDALKVTSSVKTHLSNALTHLSARPTPDYRNSIKESISAVEALCRETTGETTLGSALKTLKGKGVTIPTFLNSGFEKLYVYTNDSSTGIRHALMDDTESPHFDEAKLMLVLCSAFVNYIQGKRTDSIK